MFSYVTHLKYSLDVTTVLIMRLIKNRVINFAMGIASNQSFFKVSKCNSSSPFLLSEYQNIAVVKNVFETSSEEVRGEMSILRNGGKEAKMRKKWMIWHRPETEGGKKTAM